MKKLLIATTNKAKLKELKSYLSDLPYNLVSLKQIGFTKKYSETGTTFLKIAKNKARFYYHHTKIPSLADDGGLEIDALNGAPGVKSARWLGKKATDQELINYTLKKLAEIPLQKRTAKLKVAICLYLSPKKVFTTSASVKGIIARKPSKSKIPGYPYRSLFFLPQFKKYYDSLSKKEHQKINHRKIALEKIRKILLNNYQSE